MSATLREPGNGLSLYHPFAGIANIAPPSQELSVSFMIFLLAGRQKLRSVWPLVGASEVDVKCHLQVYPRVDTILR
jgi:hypothetical protein